MKDLDYMDIAEDAIAKIKKGAFLTVRAGDLLNTMTIGWALFGVIWQKPIMMVAVRMTRHTFGIIEQAADFTVTVPQGGMDKELALCGTKSGRDIDKFQAARLETAKAKKVSSPIIKAPGYQYECKIVYKSTMDPSHLDERYDTTIYPQKDYHTLYFGEIVACYETE
jgi:flavin reductase (DIM6/NTAB) family NADH-FMN oxidoreductase RutF